MSRNRLPMSRVRFSEGGSESSRSEAHFEAHFEAPSEAPSLTLPREQGRESDKRGALFGSYAVTSSRRHLIT